MEEKRMLEAGQSLVVVAIALLALVAFAALTVDMSSAYVTRRTAQNAADGAALAAARQLGWQINHESFSDGTVKQELNHFAELNGVLDTGGAPGDAMNANVDGWYLDEDQQRVAAVGDGSVPADVWGIEAVTHITATSFLGGVLGYSGYPLQAEAAVMLEKACGIDCVVPIATHVRNITMTAPCFEIWNGVEPGNFGWVNWDLQPYGNHCGVDTPCVADNLDPDTCKSGFLEVGMEVAATTGVKNSDLVRRELDEYLNRPQEFTTIVWEQVLDAGGVNERYIISGFARVQLVAYKLSGGQVYTSPHIGYDPTTTCVPSSAGDPTKKNIIWAEFRGWVGGEGGKCRAVGTVRAPTIIK